MEDDQAMLQLIEWAERLLDDLDQDRETQVRDESGLLLESK